MNEQQTQKKSMKKKSTVLLSLLLVAVLTVGAIMAYLFTTTEEASNVFTFAENVRARLTEPNWKEKEGEDLIPGYEVKKDPMITNTSGNGVDEYVAIRVTFTDGAGNTLTNANAAKLLGLLDISWNTNWTRANGTATSAAQIYVYKNTLSPGGVSEPVFSSVTIKSDITDADYEWLSGFYMGHSDSCYTYGACNCTVTYKHHENCAIYGITGAGAVKKGGTLSGKTCDCTPAEQHQASCNSLVGTLSCTDSTHKVTTTISGFQIKVQGAAVQAGVDENSTLTKATANLVDLLD